MSTDFQAVCFTCRKSHHLGQVMGAGFYSFGFGSRDQTGRAEVWAWLARHVDPEDGAPHHVRIMLDPPEGFEEERIRLEPAEVAARVDAATGGKRASLLAELRSYAERPYPHQHVDSGFGTSPVPMRPGDRPDPESTHSRADRILLELLGDEEITAAFVAIRRWYA